MANQQANMKKRWLSPLTRIRICFWCVGRWRVDIIVPVGDQQMNQHLIGKPVYIGTTQFISASTMRAKEPFITIPITSLTLLDKSYMHE